MNESIIRRWEIAEELYFSLVDREPFEQLKEKIKAYLNEEDGDNFPSMLRSVYYISMAVSDEDTFEMIFEYLNEYGIDQDFYSNSFGYYYLYKTLRSEIGDINAASDHFDAGLFDSPFTFPLGWIAAMDKFTASEWRFFVNVTDSFCSRAKQRIPMRDEYLYYLVSKNRLEKIKEFCEAADIGMAAALNIAMDYPEVFYGYIKDNFARRLPCYFRHGKKVRTIGELIPYLFRTKKLLMDIKLLMGIAPYNAGACTVYIISYLYDIIGMERLSKLSRYIPEIKTIELTEIVRLLRYDSELMEFVKSRTGDHITVKYSEIFLSDRNCPCVMNFIEIFADTKVHMDFSLLSVLIQRNDDLTEQLLDKGAEVSLSGKEKLTLINKILPMDDEKYVQRMIRIGAISPETWNDAVSCAVENNALKAMNVLNIQYSNVHGG